jgi:hypothetical protein
MGMLGFVYLGTPVASLYIIVVLPDSGRPRRKTLTGLRSNETIKFLIVAK